MGMGFGLMGAGAAVGGLMQGYQQGRKFAQDEERFEMEKEKFGLEKEAAGQRKRLTEEQIKGAGLLNREAEGRIKAAEEDEEDVRRSVEVVRRFMNPAGQSGAPRGAIADPASADASAPAAAPQAPVASAAPATVVTPDGTVVPAPRAGGIAPPPGAQGAPQQPQGATGPSLAQIQEMYTQLNAIGLRQMLRKHGAAETVKQAIEMSKRFSDAKTDAAIQALNGFNGGNANEVSGMLAQAGLPMPEGTKYERREVEVFPGSNYKISDVVATSPDGQRSVSLHQLMRSRMSPAEIMKHDTEVGKAVADVGLRKLAEENLERYRRGELELKGRTLQEQIRHHGAIESARMEEMGYVRQAKGDADRARALRAIEEASSLAFTQILRAQGISRETSAKDLEMLPSEQQQQIRRSMAIAVTAHGVWSMNKNSDGEPQISATEALQVIRASDSDIKSENGEVFTMFGKKKVYLPSYLAPKPQPDPKNRYNPQGVAGPAPVGQIAPPLPAR